MTVSNENNTSRYQPSLPFINYESEQILNSVSKLLKNRIFSGCYTERRLIEIGCFSAYKDVIVVDKSEYEFMKILTTVNDSLNTHFSGRVTSCIAGSKSNFSIWTSLSGVAFGSHWFLIKNVTLDKNIVNVAVKYLRPINSEPTQCVSSVSSFDWDSFSFDSNIIRNMGRNVSQIVTVENLMTSFRFLIVLFLTLLVGSYRMLQLLLKGFHELNYFVQTFTPIVLACIESITKVFGGLLILIAMMWNNKKGCKGVRNGPPPYLYPQHLTYPGVRSETCNKQAVASPAASIPLRNTISVGYYSGNFQLARSRNSLRTSPESNQRTPVGSNRMIGSVNQQPYSPVGSNRMIGSVNQQPYSPVGSTVDLKEVHRD